MIEIVIATFVGGMIGFGVCAVLTAGKVADVDGQSDLVARKALEFYDAHTRATDALNATRARIDRLKDVASNQQSVKSGRIIAVLSGDE